MGKNCLAFFRYRPAISGIPEMLNIISADIHIAWFKIIFHHKIR